jgi:hypothetical protein
MASYLRGWLSSGITAISSSTLTTTEGGDKQDVPTIIRDSPPPGDDDDEGSATETERDREDDDTPPAFPSLNSAQRVQQRPIAASKPQSKVLTDAQLMPPPPIPSSRIPGAGNGVSGSLAVPLTTTKRPSKKREKVALAPGHSPMDWANLKNSGTDLRVRDTLFLHSPSHLR